MSDLPDRLWSAAYEKLPPPEELTELLVEAAGQIVQDAWWKQTYKEMMAKYRPKQTKDIDNDGKDSSTEEQAASLHTVRSSSV